MKDYSETLGRWNKLTVRELGDPTQFAVYVNTQDGRSEPTNTTIESFEGTYNATNCSVGADPCQGNIDSPHFIEIYSLKKWIGWIYFKDLESDNRLQGYMGHVPKGTNFNEGGLY